MTEKEEENGVFGHTSAYIFLSTTFLEVYDFEQMISIAISEGGMYDSQSFYPEKLSMPSKEELLEDGHYKIIPHQLRIEYNKGLFIQVQVTVLDTD